MICPRKSSLCYMYNTRAPLRHKERHRSECGSVVFIDIVTCWQVFFWKSFLLYIDVFSSSNGSFLLTSRPAEFRMTKVLPSKICSRILPNEFLYEKLLLCFQFYIAGRLGILRARRRGQGHYAWCHAPYERLGKNLLPHHKIVVVAAPLIAMARSA